MIDHMSADARLAHLRAAISHQQPSWVLEIGACLVAVAMIIAVLALGQAGVAVNGRTQAEDEAAFWRELALAPYPDSKCSTLDVPREWRGALAAECDVLADLLRHARPDS